MRYYRRGGRIDKPVLEFNSKRDRKFSNVVKSHSRLFSLLRTSKNWVRKFVIPLVCCFGRISDIIGRAEHPAKFCQIGITEAES
jgi:hypothetical protein